MITNPSLALLTDLYQLTMAYGYWEAKLENREAVFHQFFRRPPFQGGYAIAAGLENLIHFIKNFKYTSEDLEYLQSINIENKPLFEPKFLDYLSNLKLNISIDALPEGTVCFPFTPMIRVQGPLIQCQLLETPLLNLINFSTLIATKASRIVTAAAGNPVLEFGLRRAQGIDGALNASRSAYVGGVDATSNVLAGKLYGIPVSGTMAHSWILAFDNELEAFAEMSKVLPDNCIFLVDTFDTLQGVKNAIEIGHLLTKKGHKFLGIRLDSGDLAHLSIRARSMLNRAGFTQAKIYASNELDEFLIADLKRQGAKIDAWGVGTSLVTGKDQSHLDGVYKLSAIRDPGKPWVYKLKLSEQLQKISNPGILQVRRYFHKDQAVADVIFDQEIGMDQSPEFFDPLDPTKRKKITKEFDSIDLLKPIFKEGQLIYKSPALQDIRSNTKKNLDLFPKEIKRFLNPQSYNVGYEKKLHLLKLQLIEKVRINKEEI